jgi:Fe-S-cluster containining protein
MEYERVFYHDGYELASEKLNSLPVRQAIIEIQNSAYASIDGLIDSFCKRCTREGLGLDCTEGCSWCCSQAVLASTHEVLYMFSWMEKELSPEKLEQIRKKAEKRHRYTSSMKVWEFLHFIHPCPFLENGICMVYPVRPVACRIYLSSDLESCMAQYNSPNDSKIMARLYEFPLRAGRLINEGIRRALAEKGIVTAEWLIESFICQVLDDRNILTRWIDDYKSFRIREMDREEKLYMKAFQGNRGSS